MPEDLASQDCVPCRGGVPPMKGAELRRIQQLVPQWTVVNEHHITRAFTFPDFKQALDFVNRVGEIAEQSGTSSRHPARMGESGDHSVDAQDRWPDPERLHHGGQDRPTLEIDSRGDAASRQAERSRQRCA